MTEDKTKFLFFVLFLSLGIVSGIFGSLLQSEYGIINMLFDKQEVGIEGLDTTTLNDIIIECDDNNSRIDKELDCVMKHVDRFYFYIIRKDDENISFETLMNDGGDCLNWANFWEHVATELGYDVTPIHIDVDEKTAHRFSIISNSEGYCRIDQTNIECNIYG